jgi:hypothetical protein
VEFTLIYQGSLKANGSLREKQEIRRQFHKQLAVLWLQPPLLHCKEWLTERRNGGDICLLRKVGSFTFAPIVTPDLALLAELEIVFLRPEAPGSLITQGGDIDNRLKTLFDALRMPKAQQELVSGDFPLDGEAPFHCLLEDDNLVSRVSVTTDRLLDASANNNHAHLLIKVTTKKISGTWGNLGLA